jgi:cardiolipin synthase
VERLTAVLKGLPSIPPHAAGEGTEFAAAVPDRHRHLFLLGQSISGFNPVGGNTAHLLADSNATIDAMVADIDLATDHVHVLFYIWLPDHNGSKVVEALKRAAARGVTCRAMADDLGSRTIIRSEHWQATRAAGVRVAAGLPIGNPLLRPFEGRIDLRNHRKIVVVDDRITYCGSQNCADPEFRVKAKYAPWVDAVMRFEGPIARQNQFLFASDWMTYVDENLDELLSKAPPLPMPGGAPAQVIGTGPTVRYSAMPEMFESLMFAARREIVVTTPYYVPDEALQNALCTTAYRGVDTTDRLSRQERLVDRRSGQPQLLRGPAHRGGQDLRVRGRPAAHEIADAGWRGHLDRLGEHGPPQFRAQLREQHPVPRSRTHRHCARAPAGIHRAVESGH